MPSEEDRRNSCGRAHPQARFTRHSQVAVQRSALRSLDAIEHSKPHHRQSVTEGSNVLRKLVLFYCVCSLHVQSLGGNALGHVDGFT